MRSVILKNISLTALSLLTHSSLILSQADSEIHKHQENYVEHHVNTYCMWRVRKSLEDESDSVPMWMWVSESGATGTTCQEREDGPGCVSFYFCEIRFWRKACLWKIPFGFLVSSRSKSKRTRTMSLATTLQPWSTVFLLTSTRSAQMAVTLEKNTKSPQSLPLWSRESSVIQLTMRFVRCNTTDLFPSRTVSSPIK